MQWPQHARTSGNAGATGNVRDSLTAVLDRGGPTDPGDRFWLEAWHSPLKGETQWKPLMTRVAEALKRR